MPLSKITPSYAALSLQTGFMAGAADEYLGGTHFITKTREEAWSLTPEKLAAWKREAIAMGVPAEQMEMSATESELAGFLTLGLAMQAEVDRAVEANEKTKE